VKILATFDESPFSEATIPVLITLSGLPDAAFDLVSVMEVTSAFDEESIGTRRQELVSYLNRIAGRLPDGANCRVSTEVAMHPMDAATILLERARSERPDIIVMATHGRSGLVRALLGSVADKIVRSGIAPVLVVRPRADGDGSGSS
jgi:nucleotide-binding universal stress UspA family protein